MRRLDNYIQKYGEKFGPILYHARQSQAAHAGVSARLRRKLGVLSGRTTPPRRPEEGGLPLFPETEHGKSMSENVELLAIGE